MKVDDMASESNVNAEIKYKKFLDKMKKYIAWKASL